MPVVGLVHNEYFGIGTSHGIEKLGLGWLRSLHEFDGIHCVVVTNPQGVFHANIGIRISCCCCLTVNHKGAALDISIPRIIDLALSFNLTDGMNSMLQQKRVM